MAGDCFSNLTTLYPRLPFGRKTVSQIMERPGNIGRAVLDEKGAFNRVMLKNFIPPVSFETPEGRIGVFHSHVSFGEIGNSKKLWKSIKGKYRSAKGRSAILSFCENETHGFNMVQLFRQNEKHPVPCSLVERDALYRMKGVLEFHVVLSIFLQELPPDLLIPSPRTEENCKRTALLSRELIGGYRRTISIVQYYSGYRDEIPKTCHGHSSASDFHATNEDADRLIAHFQFLRAELKKLGIDPLKLGLRNLKELKMLPADDDHNWSYVLQKLSDQLVVSRITVARKLFEHAIYIDLEK